MGDMIPSHGDCQFVVEEETVAAAPKRVRISGKVDSIAAVVEEPSAEPCAEPQIVDTEPEWPSQSCPFRNTTPDGFENGTHPIVAS